MSCPARPAPASGLPRRTVLRALAAAPLLGAASAPAATPATILRQLNEEAIKALASPEVKERLNKLGADPMPMPPEAFNAFIRSEMNAAAVIARAAGLKAN